MGVPHLDLLIKRPAFREEGMNYFEYLNRRSSYKILDQNLMMYNGSFVNINANSIYIDLREYLKEAKLYDYYVDFFNNVCRYLEKSFNNPLKVTMSFKRIVIGIGEKGVYDVGLTLHPVFGIPYIPGSALKGVFRRIISARDPTLLHLFGSLEASGLVDFSDGLINPHKNTIVYLDILSRHVSPDDYDETRNPNPVRFFAIKNADFTFFIVTQRASKRALEKLSEALNDIITSDGDFSILSFGAKTSAGYGWVKKIKIEKR